MEELFVFLNYLNKYTPFFVGTATVVIGILITVNRNRYCRVLGISFILSGAVCFITGVPRILIESGMEELYGRIYYVFNLSIFIFSILSVFFVCLFLHRKYGKRFVYIPVLLIGVVGSFINSIVILLLARILGGGYTASLWSSLVGTIDSFVLNTATAMIIIVIFFRNREGEKVIPRAWLFRLITWICYAVSTIIDCIIYACYISNQGPVQGEMDIFYCLAQIVFTSTNLIFPAYILAGTIKNKTSEAS